MRALQDPMFKIAQNEVNFKKNNMTFKALRYCLKTSTKKMPHPPFHLEKEGGQKV
jgi:hypothetical protein